MRYFASIIGLLLFLDSYLGTLFPLTLCFWKAISELFIPFLLRSNLYLKAKHLLPRTVQNGAGFL